MTKEWMSNLQMIMLNHNLAKRLLIILIKVVAVVVVTKEANMVQEVR